VPLLQHFGSHLVRFGLPLSSEMSVPSLKFIHVSASVQCPVVASSSSGFLAFDSRLRFCLRFSVGFSVLVLSSLVSSLVQNLLRVIQSSVSISVSQSSCPVSVSVLRLSSSTPRFRRQIPVHPCLSVIV
jgi:hypothetical protein